MRDRHPFVAGQRFGQWTVLEERGNKPRRMLVRCDCGVERVVAFHTLYLGTSTGCGGHIRGGRVNRASRKGAPLNKEYWIYHSMHARCEKPKSNGWRLYGARGITVCERWSGPNGFANFIADMGPKPTPQHSLDRVDGNKGYSPDNCRWATAKEQVLNSSNTVWIEADGERLCITDWARKLGVCLATLQARLARGWPPALAVTTPRIRSKDGAWMIPDRAAKMRINLLRSAS